MKGKFAWIGAACPSRQKGGALGTSLSKWQKETLQRDNLFFNSVLHSAFGTRSSSFTQNFAVDR